MTEKEMRCVRALRICHSNEDCRDCEFMKSDSCEKSCVTILFEDSADIIESLSAQLEAAQPKWISVETEHPKDQAVVLIYCNDGEVGTARFEEEYGCFVTTEKGTWKGAYGAVTHWMNLPEPPKEET